MLYRHISFWWGIFSHQSAQESYGISKATPLAHLFWVVINSVKCFLPAPQPSPFHAAHLWVAFWNCGITHWGPPKDITNSQLPFAEHQALFQDLQYIHSFTPLHSPPKEAPWLPTFGWWSPERSGNPSRPTLLALSRPRNHTGLPGTGAPAPSSPTVPPLLIQHVSSRGCCLSTSAPSDSQITSALQSELPPSLKLARTLQPLRQALQPLRLPPAPEGESLEASLLANLQLSFFFGYQLSTI